MGEIGHGDDGLGDGRAAPIARASRREQAVASPLLEDVNLAGARGVLVNITASSGLKMKEYHEVMNTIKEFTAEDAMVIVGTVIDDAMDDRLRVTMVATGLGGAVAATQAPAEDRSRRPTIVERTGTDNVGVQRRRRSTTTSSTQPAVMRARPRRAADVGGAGVRRARRSRRSCASRRTERGDAASRMRDVPPCGSRCRDVRQRVLTCASTPC